MFYVAQSGAVWRHQINLLDCGAIHIPYLYQGVMLERETQVLGSLLAENVPFTPAPRYNSHVLNRITAGAWLTHMFSGKYVCC